VDFSCFYSCDEHGGVKECPVQNYTSDALIGIITKLARDQHLPAAEAVALASMTTLNHATDIQGAIKLLGGATFETDPLRALPLHIQAAAMAVAK
jgi:hypothetical protein